MAIILPTSLIKSLRLKFGVLRFNTLVNRCENAKAASDINQRLASTCFSFLPDVHISNLGWVPNYDLNRFCIEEKFSTCEKLSNVFFLLNLPKRYLTQ